MAPIVIATSAPLATDLSARSNVISTSNATNAATATVAHIGKFGECRIWSNQADQAAESMRVVP